MLRSFTRMQSPFKHTVWVGGRKTSVNLEPEFWDQLRLIVMERQTTVGSLIAEIDRTMRLMPFQGPGRHRVRTLSAAVRVFVLREILARAENPIERATQRPVAARH
jgi:predicted DNA-binding ribbon-helix-helix protein